MRALVSRSTAACGLVVALAVGFGLGSIGGSANAQHGGAARTWPPAPADMVTLPVHKETRIGTSLGTPGYLYYEVPIDRALVVTDVVGDMGASTVIYEEAFQKSTPKISMKGASGVRTEYHSAVGVSFAPGSKVVMMNYTPDIQMTGYLTTP